MLEGFPRRILVSPSIYSSIFRYKLYIYPQNRQDLN